MIKITTEMKISSLEELAMYSELIMETGIKINKTKLAKELNVDRRTVDKYLKGYVKGHTRKKKTKLDYLYKIIETLLASSTQQFYYVSNLYRYLKDTEELKCSESTFRYYINKHEEFRQYFMDGKKISNSKCPVLMFETPKGEQAQIDWKESQKYILNDGEEIEINIFSFILSYSRFRIYFLSIEKERQVLFDFLTRCFEVIGGVPKEILTDNMKTVMDESRTQYYKGKINKEFEDFAKNMGFKTRPCIAGSPKTKGKVESPMRILDELYAYSGTLSFEEIVQKLSLINDRENLRYHKEYGRIPADSLKEEKGFLLPLPNETIRNQYKVVRHKAKVSSRCTIRINNCNYSLPVKYFGKEIEYSLINNRVYIYFKSNLVRTHTVSENLFKLNESDYIEVLKMNNLINKENEEEVIEIAKKSLKAIGELHGITK